MTQQTMFDDFDRQRMVQPDRPIKPPHNGTETSKAAAEAIALISGDQERLVYDYIASKGELGATNGETSRALGVPEKSVSPRTNALARKGKIVKGEQRRNENNRLCQAWKVAK